MFDCLPCQPSRPKSFHVKILLLDKQELIQEVQAKTTGKNLLDCIFKYLNLVETAYFGLRYQDASNQTHWLDPNKRVCRELKGLSPVTLYFGVKFYAADPCRLLEEITRYQFFLQVKLDILQGRLPVTHDLAVELAALSLQSELGDHSPMHHSPGYASEFRFSASQTEEMEADIEMEHQKLMGIRPAQAEMRYLEKVKWLDMYGVDLHPVIGDDSIEYFLGLTPSGIIFLRNRDKVGNYFWPRISKINFKGRFFMLRVKDKSNDESTYGFKTPSRQACKHLWKCCVEHHAFFRLVQMSASFSGSGVFSLHGKNKSGFLEKSPHQSHQAAGQPVMRRPPPQFARRPSTRYARRDGQPSSAISTHHRETNSTENNVFNGSLNRAMMKKQNRLSTGSLPRSLSGLRPPSASNEVNAQDVSLQSLQWLESRGLFGSNSRSALNTSNSRRPSMSEGNRRSSRKSHSGGHHIGNSDNESEMSAISWTSGGLGSVSAAGAAAAAGTNTQRRFRNESGSESERSSSRRAQRSRRKRQSSYKLIESDEQWQAVVQSQRRSRTPTAASTRSQDGFANRRSGYVNSGAETEAETVVSATGRRSRQRRHRSRSRSPATEARARMPKELIQHLEFGLVEPNPDCVKGEIPYTSVKVQQQQQQARANQQLTRRSRHNSGTSSHVSHARRIHVPPPPPQPQPPPQPYTSSGTPTYYNLQQQQQQQRQMQNIQGTPSPMQQNHHYSQNYVNQMPSGRLQAQDPSLGLPHVPNSNNPSPAVNRGNNATYQAQYSQHQMQNFANRTNGPLAPPLPPPKSTSLNYSTNYVAYSPNTQQTSPMSMDSPNHRFHHPPPSWVHQPAVPSPARTLDGPRGDSPRGRASPRKPIPPPAAPPKKHPALAFLVEPSGDEMSTEL